MGGRWAATKTVCSSIDTFAGVDPVSAQCLQAPIQVATHISDVKK